MGGRLFVCVGVCVCVGGGGGGATKHSDYSFRNLILNIVH